MPGNKRSCYKENFHCVRISCTVVPAFKCRISISGLSNTRLVLYVYVARFLKYLPTSLIVPFIVLTYSLFEFTLTFLRTRKNGYCRSYRPLFSRNCLNIVRIVKKKTKPSLVWDPAVKELVKLYAAEIRETGSWERLQINRISSLCYVYTIRSGSRYTSQYHLWQKK